MKCFICAKYFAENDNLFKHLKEYHFLKTHDNYMCCESVYTNSSTFKRHIKKNMLTTNLQILVKATRKFQAIYKGILYVKNNRLMSSVILNMIVNTVTTNLGYRIYQRIAWNFKLQCIRTLILQERTLKV